MKTKKRGGERVAGPGKRIGRPKKSEAEKKKRHEIWVSNRVWARAVEVLEQETGATGKTCSHVLAEALDRLVAGRWRPALIDAPVQSEPAKTARAASRSSPVR